MGLPVLEESTEYESTSHTTGSIGNYTVVSHSGNMLIVLFSFNGSSGVRTISSVYFDGVLLTELDFQNKLFMTTAIWYLTNPPVGTGVLEVNLNNTSNKFLAVAATISGVDAADPINTTNKDSGDAETTPSITDTTTADNCLTVSSCGGSDISSGYTTDVSQTEIGNYAIPSWCGAISHKDQVSAGSFTHSYTTDSGYFTIISAAIQGVSFTPQVRLF